MPNLKSRCEEVIPVILKTEVPSFILMKIILNVDEKDTLVTQKLNIMGHCIENNLFHSRQKRCPSMSLQEQQCSTTGDILKIEYLSVENVKQVSDKLCKYLQKVLDFRISLNIYNLHNNECQLI